MTGETELKQAAMGNYSALSRWLYEHHDDVAAIVARTKRVSWVGLARFLHESHGLVGASGRPPTNESVRHAWRRVHAAVLAQRAQPHVPSIADEVSCSDDYDVRPRFTPVRDKK